MKKSQKPRATGSFFIPLDDLIVDEKKNMRFAHLYESGDDELGNEQASIAELAASMKKEGQLQPCIVVETPKGWELRAGFRRYRAAKKAGLATLHVVPYYGDEKSIAAIAATENIGRKKASAVEIAHEVHRLATVDKLSQSEIASRVTLSQPSVANYLQIMKLQKPILDAWKKTPGAFTWRELLDLSKTSPEHQLSWFHARLGVHMPSEKKRKGRGRVRRASIDSVRKEVERGAYDKLTPRAAALAVLEALGGAREET